MADKHGELRLDISLLAAEGLQQPSSFIFSAAGHRPYVAVSTPYGAVKTGVAECGLRSPAWGDTLRVAVTPAFLDGTGDGVCVAVMTEGGRFFFGPSELGWCKIAATDVLDGLHPPGVRHRVSYALRCHRYGCRSSAGCNHGVLHMSVRVVGVKEGMWTVDKMKPPPPTALQYRMAIGVPVPLCVQVGIPVRAL